MIFNFLYIALVHSKWKPGKCEIVKNRFKGYNKGNFKFAPSFLYVVEEGHEEQVTILEVKVKSILYDYLENPEFHKSPTEYVNRKFKHINGVYIESIVDKIIAENNLAIKKIKSDYMTDSVKDAKFLDKVRMFPKKYLETI